MIPRERIVYPAPSPCPCCGGTLHKIGEDVTEMLELIPRRWKVIQQVDFLKSRRLIFFGNQGTKRRLIRRPSSSEVPPI
jgi:transposase